MTNSISDIEKADVILVAGSNMTENHPVIGQSIKRAVLNHGAKLILVDPRRVPLARYATIHLRPRPGTDIAWLNSMAAVIVGESLYDKAFVERRTEGFDKFIGGLDEYTTQSTQDITGIPADDLRAAARLYAKSPRASIFYAMGITQHLQGTDNVRAIANLALLCGQIGKPGSGVNPLRGQNNVQGACDMGALPAFLPGYQRVDDEPTRKKFSKAWSRDISGKRGMTIGEMIDAARNGELKALLVFGENPAVTEPDSEAVEEALRGLGLLVVQDLFLTETAAMADVVLPGRCFAEKTGTFTSTERRVQLVRAAVDPLGSARTEAETVCALSELLGYGMNADSAQVMKEIADVTPSYAGISHQRLNRGGIQWPCPSTRHPGTPILHVDRFTRGKGSFARIDYRTTEGSADERDYPMVLTTGRLRYNYHANSMTGRTALAEMAPQGFVEMNPADADSLRLSDSDTVILESRTGKVTSTLRISSDTPPGILFMSFHFPDERANRLVSPAFDPKSGIPEYKVTPVRVKRPGGVTDE